MPQWWRERVVPARATRPSVRHPPLNLAPFDAAYDRAMAGLAEELKTIEEAPPRRVRVVRDAA